MLPFREVFDSDKQAWKERAEEEMKKTKKVVRGILSRLSLLLHVNITPAPAQLPLTRTVSHMQGFPQGEDVLCGLAEMHTFTRMHTHMHAHTHIIII